MLTLTGSGGCGKTRLALELAARALERFPDGTWLVELTPITDASLVPSAVAAAVGVREQQGRRVARCPRRPSRVADRARGARQLRAPRRRDRRGRRTDPARMPRRRGARDEPRATRRARRNRVAGPEPVVPQRARAARIDTLAQYEAVQLFVERARKVRPNFNARRHDGRAGRGDLPPARRHPARGRARGRAHPRVEPAADPRRAR